MDRRSVLCGLVASGMVGVAGLPTSASEKGFFGPLVNPCKDVPSPQMTEPFLRAQELMTAVMNKYPFGGEHRMLIRHIREHHIAKGVAVAVDDYGIVCAVFLNDDVRHAAHMLKLKTYYTKFDPERDTEAIHYRYQDGKHEWLSTEWAIDLDLDAITAATPTT
jgi:hypothetical protein